MKGKTKFILRKSDLQSTEVQLFFKKNRKNPQQFLIDLNLYLQSPLGSVFKFRFNKNVIRLPKNIQCLISNNYMCFLVLVLPSYNEGDIIPSFCRKEKKTKQKTLRFWRSYMICLKSHRQGASKPRLSSPSLPYSKPRDPFTEYEQHVCCMLCSVTSVMSDSLQTPQTVARQAPQSMGFSRQEY